MMMSLVSLSAGHGRDRPVEARQADVELVQELPCLLGHAGVLQAGEDAEDAGCEFASEEDVLRDVEAVDQSKVLVQRGDAGGQRVLRRGDGVGDAVHGDGAAVGGLGTGEDLDQG